MYYEGPFKAWADDLASEKSVPGGGSAAALAGTTGCALLAMAANFTLNRKKFAAVADEVGDSLRAIEELRGRLARLIDEDVEQYAAVTAALGMPKGTDEEKARRRAAMQEALKTVVRVPLETCRLCSEAIKHAQTMAHKANPNLISDVGVGLQCLAAAWRSAWLNVEINLAGLSDPAFVAGIRAELEPARAEMERAAAQSWEVVVGKVVKQA